MAILITLTNLAAYLKASMSDVHAHAHTTPAGDIKTFQSLQWRHNEYDCVSNHRRLYCLPNRLFRHRSKKSSASLAFVWGIHRSPVNSPHKRPVTRKMFPFYDVIMNRICIQLNKSSYRVLNYVEISLTPHVIYFRVKSIDGSGTDSSLTVYLQGDVITWKRSSHYWPFVFVRRIQRWPMGFMLA